MKRLSKSGMLLFLLLSLTVISCGGPKYCCTSAEEGSVLRSYCKDYSGATARFIRKPELKQERVQRKEDLKKFIKDLDNCSTILCIENAVDTTAKVPEFKSFFYDAHPHAQDRAVNIESDRVKFLLCGLKNGLTVSTD